MNIKLLKRPKIDILLAIKKDRLTRDGYIWKMTHYDI